MSRQIWMNFLVQKLFRLLGRETQIVEKGQKQTVLTGTKVENGRGRSYSVYSTEESASCCSQRF